MDSYDEFISECQLNGVVVPVNTLTKPTWEWPESGTLTVIYTYFSAHEPMTASNYAAIVQEVRGVCPGGGEEEARSAHSCGAVANGQGI
jgi:hypothetical protein